MDRTYGNKHIFESMPIPKAVMTMAVPTIMGQLIVLIYSMADTFFVGLTNDPYMVSGASLILPVFNISLSIAGLAGVGGGSQISRLLGQKEEAEAERVFSFSIWFSIAVAAVFSLAVALFMGPLMGVLGAGPENSGFAADYAFCVIVLGGVPTVMSNVLSNMLRSTGESKKAGFGVMMGGILNIGLDPLFMFVLFPDGMEITGAGIATALSNIISCVYFIIVIKRLGNRTVLRLHGPWVRPGTGSIKKVFSVGIPSSITTLLFDLDYVVLDRLMASHSAIALAAVGIVLKAERLPLNIGVGICQGMMPLTAYNYSSKNHERMQGIIRFSRRLGLICALVSIAMYEIFAPYIMQFFIRDAATVELGTIFLRCRSLATVFMFFCFFHVYLFNSFGRGSTALFLGVSRWAIFNIPMLFLMDHFFGMYGLVLSQVAADILMVILSVVVFRRFERELDDSGCRQRSVGKK